MTIKLQLRVSILISVALIAGFGWLLFSAFQQADEATDRGRTADEIGQGVVDQKFLTSDFLLHKEERARIQWNAKHDSLTLFLKEAEVGFKSPKDSAVLNTISLRHERTKDVFSQLANALETESDGSGGSTVIRELSERLETQLLIASQEMVSGASQLAEGSRQDIRDAQDRARWVVVAFLTTMGIIISMILLWLTAKVLRPIARLRSGTEIIGQGNLDHRFENTSRDEFGELSRAFDQMTTDLRSITASRDELNQEITGRRRAEEQAERSADEARFLSSTVQVAATMESFDQALEQCLDIVGRYVGWPLGHIYVPAADGTGELEPTSTWYLADPQAFQAFRQVTEQTRFSPGVGLPGRVLSSGEPVWIVDVLNDGNFPRNKAPEEIEVRGAFAFPVKIGSETVAVFEFFAVEPMESDEQILDLMRLVGLQIGQVLERERTREELLQQSEELRQSNEQLNRLLEFVPHSIVVINQTGTIKKVNAQTTSVFGYSEDDLLGQGVEILLPERFKDLHFAHRKDWFSDPQARPMGSGLDLYARRKNGNEFPIDISISPVNIADETWGIAIVQDITDRKENEELIRNLNNGLRQSNSELEAFSYSVSHDLRAPLRAIGGFSQILMLEHSPQLPPQAQHYLEMVQQGAQQMGQLIDDLLTFSRLNRQGLQKLPVELELLVKQVVTELDNEQEGRHVEISIDALPTCRGDPALLKQVFLNLLGNSLKFTSKRDEAIIEIGYRDDVSGDKSGEGVYFVKDNGVGFDMRYADNLFGVFQRLHRSADYEGTGVGLAIVQRIILRHGGRIWAEAEVNKGATFYFTLEGGTSNGTME